MEMKDKVAIVTGAGQGIGEATAKCLGGEGASVVVVDMNSSTGNDTANDIKDKGGTASFVEADVSAPDAVKKMVDHAVSTYGSINTLINIAGIQGMVADIVDLPEDVWYSVVNVNLTSVYLCSKYCIPHMRKIGGGAIVNVASMQSYFNMPGSSAYAAAKGGIVSLTRSMALDFARENIRVNAVAPGYINTPLLQSFAEETGDAKAAIAKWSSRIPIGRLQEPEEVAQVILFLASARASAVTGVTYPVDGGILTAQPTWEP